MAEMTIEDLRAAAAAAKKRRLAAVLTPEQEERARLLQELDEDRAAARADEKKQRALAGATAETDARTEARGKYLVRFTDLGSMLADADPDTLPGRGVLVLRSPRARALTDFQRELEAEQRDLQAVYTTLLLECIVRPEITTDEVTGAKCAAFFESDLGAGAVVTLGDAAAALGGAVRTRTKRGRG